MRNRQTLAGKRSFSRAELVDRWRWIQEELDDDDPSPLKHQELLQAKEQWFSDSFQFLMDLPTDDHIWCGCSEIMGPLLETLHRYFDENQTDSPLKLIWKRLSQEMKRCSQCISQHHQAQEAFSSEYESDVVDPLLKVLHCLDEERVTEHLKEMNEKLKRRKYDPESHSPEVVSIMFEVLTYPTLLDDQALVDEFQFFIEEIDKSHDVNFAGNQQYPGVYALLFLKTGRARAIGLRLAGCMGKLWKASDLEPLQPLLRKYIAFLETEVSQSNLDSSRPRVKLERANVWLGIKTLLGFLAAPTFEDGILEKYPNFLSVILNHISDDTLESSYSITCLRASFEMLGCKLWWRTTLSPSVMRNTLLGQCFHTRNEKSHKDIFDLFLPFLQSLEALQDGDHEKQRRHFLYFLLHQVTQSSNFSVLTRKNARKIALLIIHRGYKIDPPCPPFECAHIWGPSLVSSLKDSSLHSSLRQPAFDLMQTIIVSDASALASLKLKHNSIPNIDSKTYMNYVDDEDEIPFFHDVEEESSCWSEFNMQSKLASRVCKDWICVPMLWHDVLIEAGPATLPVSLSKATFWALSHVSMAHTNSSIDLSVHLRDWLSSYAGEISSSFGWEAPNGCDDGGDGKESRNSVLASAKCSTLIHTFKRFAVYFIIQMERHELHKQWTWEPRMAECLIIFTIDPNHVVRQSGKVILDHVSKALDMTSQLKFLCLGASLSSVLLGLRYAVKQVQMDSISTNFHKLQFLLHVVGKLVKDVMKPPLRSSIILLEGASCEKFSSEGGFLRQPCTDNLESNSGWSTTIMDMESWEKFCYLLASLMWPFILNILREGKDLMGKIEYQAVSSRLLDIVPSIFEKLHSPASKLLVSSVPIVSGVLDFKWLSDLLDWGKSSLNVVQSHWKQSMLSLMDILKASCSNFSEFTISVIEAILQSDNFSVDKLKEEIHRLTISLINEVSFSGGAKLIKETSLLPESCFGANISKTGTGGSKKDVYTERTQPSQKLEDQEVIDLSDEEEPSKIASPKLYSTLSKLSCIKDEPSFAGKAKLSEEPSKIASPKLYSTLSKSSCIKDEPSVAGKAKLSDGPVKSVSTNSSRDILEPFPRIFFDEEEEDDLLDNNTKLSTEYSSTGRHLASHMKEKSNSLKKAHNLVPQLNNANSVRKGPSIQPVKSKLSTQTVTSRTSKVEHKIEKENVVIKELVCDDKDDPLERALDTIKRPQTMLTKPIASVPKRKVVQLQMPTNNKSGFLGKMGAGARRLKPPRLDDWYRPILELDYFAVVGLSSTDEKNYTSTKDLKEVPLCFQSMEHYVEIFRPLVLEEFKAQLQSSYLETSQEDIYCGSLNIHSVERTDDFHIVRGRPDEGESASSKGCSENDLVLLTREPLKNDKKSVQDIHVLGKVERREKSNKSRSVVLVIRFYLPNNSSRLNKVRRLLIERSKWHVNRIMSITPQVREFQALSSLHDIPVLPIILNPVDRSLGRSEYGKVELDKLSKPLQDMLMTSFSDSQLRAITFAIGTQASRRNFELCLIQGPPGTGKTRTIVATVSALLSLHPMRGNCTSKLNNALRPTTLTSNNSRTLTGQSAAVARAWQDAAFAKQMIRDTENDVAGPTERPARARILICAQSNAAVDELVARISDGLYGNDAKVYKPYLVRVGNAKTVHPNSHPFFIDTLVEQRLAEDMVNTESNNVSNMETSSLLRSRLEKIVDSIRVYEAKRAALESTDTDTIASSDGAPKVANVQEMSAPEIAAKLNILYGQKRETCGELAAAQSREKKISEENWALKKKIRKSILMEAEIVVTTLSGCGGDLYGVCSESASSNKFGRFSEQCLFDVVIIDEAAQALEPASLIPLQLLKSNATRCIMVGDPKQLPATVLSNVASKFLYECSMFERLQKAGHPVIMLTEQYRMNSEICKFPSLHFYDNKLQNGAQMASKSAPFHQNVYLGPYMFYDIVDGCEHHGKNSASLSLYNEHEVEAAVGILKLLQMRFKTEFTSRKVGIITPYRSQLALLRSRFSSAFGAHLVSEMEFNTVDGFQGREVDILILSTVRASEAKNSSSLGFVADVRRMNVALTRAKFSLWVLGNARTLQRNLHWAALIQNAKERDLYVSISKPYDLFFKKDSVRDNSSSKQAGNVKDASGTQHNRHNAKKVHRGDSGSKDEKIDAHSKARSQTSFSNKFPSVDIPKGHSKDRNLTTRSSTNCEDSSNKALIQKRKEEGKLSPDEISHKSERASLSLHHNAEKSNLTEAKNHKQPNMEGTASNSSEKVKRRRRFSEQARSNISGCTPSTLPPVEGSQEVIKSNDGRRSSSGDAPRDLLASRKRRRDDVEALLSSSLISSKKPETSSKSGTVDRTSSVTAGRVKIKPYSAKNVPKP